MTQVDEAAPRLGRKRDPSRDTDILDATLEVLAETGYEGMTIDMVAARAKAGKATVYRRWTSKADLVIDAVACMKAGVDLNALPDTGTLRGDLVAMIKAPAVHDAQRKARIMGGLISLINDEPGLAEAAQQAVVLPRVAANRILFQRAIDRGEVPADIDVDLLSLVSVSMVSYRTLMLREPVDRAFLLSIIDGVILPAVRGCAGA
ncbi:TetR/AcrR family transcriptional regulator [Galbitalea sp. SE-J8]|uniref:TetR/AcrR family transcriptional regulator n=1 Tax=Galbitalea sp. SE-J8 TaxID=3054952 RepID=UPI00259C8E5C|nr:TetR/AcrR family transcriptional regulator [Galbitalea sp. SE-J8]MDM4762190.1 TetR/AcrR family transcriptional regulator [Galbitalea sp. SE-J8]